jgi:glycolate oxidase FAD binding subunit
MPTPLRLEPADAEAAAAMLAQAAADKVSLVLHGNRTKMGTAAGTEQRAAISTTGLKAGLAHYAGDLVATAPAGCTLRDVNAALARERQWIPLDPPFDERATIGGVVAANDSGPRRHRFGSPRDLVIGIEVALASGRVAHAGGRVVKNVAGYDLARLFCGSYGSLGLITSVTFKLAPVAPASRTVVSRFATARDAALAASRLAASPALTPSTIEIVAPGARLLVRFESTERSARQMAETAARELAAGGSDVVMCEGDAEVALWSEHQALESADSGFACAISVLPTQVGAAIDDVERLAVERGLTWSLTGRAAMGALRVRATGAPLALRQFAAGLRTAVIARGGHAQLTRGHELLAETLDPWGEVGSAAAVGFAVKQRFDPSGVLPYPWARG